MEATLELAPATSGDNPHPQKRFIVHDGCGHNENLGRFTAMPDGDTLLCQPWMAQSDWDMAQLKWFQQFGGAVVVHRCPRGPYRETGDTMGTVAEIVERLQVRVGPHETHQVEQLATSGEPTDDHPPIFDRCGVHDPEKCGCEFVGFGVWSCGYVEPKGDE